MLNALMNPQQKLKVKITVDKQGLPLEGICSLCLAVWKMQG